VEDGGRENAWLEPEGRGADVEGNGMEGALIKGLSEYVIGAYTYGGGGNVPGWAPLREEDEDGPGVAMGWGSASVSVSEDDVEPTDDELVRLNRSLNLRTLKRGGGFWSHSAGGWRRVLRFTKKTKLWTRCSWPSVGLKTYKQQAWMRSSGWG
jgi:hypothetical protein